MYDINELRRSGHTPRFHGAGFTQLYISETKRLHVWHPAMPAIIRDGLIHDHNFDMYSRVLYGAIDHIVYEFLPPYPGRRATGSLWQVAGKGGGLPAKFLSPGHVVSKQMDVHIPKDGSYNFPRRTLHTTRGKGVTITEMHKLYVDRDYWPRCVSDTPDTAPDDAFPVEEPHSTAELWDVIDEALAAMYGHTRRIGYRTHPTPRICDAVQTSDQVTCKRCNISWDVNDTSPPECRHYD